jgi:hypothetical protein
LLALILFPVHYQTFSYWLAIAQLDLCHLLALIHINVISQLNPFEAMVPMVAPDLERRKVEHLQLIILVFLDLLTVL